MSPFGRRLAEAAMTAGPDEVIEAMARLRRDGQAFALATVVRTRPATSARVGAKALVRADGAVLGWVGGGCLEGAVRQAAARALADGRARMIRVRPAEQEAADDGVEEHRSSCPSGGTAEIFVEPFLPRPSLLVAGDSQTARALGDLARRLGFAVTAAARPEDLVPPAGDGRRLEGVPSAGPPGPSPTFVVVATQGQRDCRALEAALATGAGYVGFVGSRRKVAELTRRLLARGLDRERVAALRAPAGLDIGAQTPEEIALSILAEIVRELRRAMPAGLVEDEVVEGAAEPARTRQPPAGEGCCAED